ncbi:MAG: hypothetical protein WDO15_01630 [Bacteroidota bacterium]
MITDGIEQWQIEGEANRNPAYNHNASTVTGLSLSSSASAGIGPGPASGVLGGHSMVGSFSMPMASSGPASNFTMTFTTSAFVWSDFTDLKSSVGRALSYQPLWLGPYVIREALNNNSALRTRVNNLMSQNLANYRLTHGTYGVQFQYQWPRGSEGIHQRNKSSQDFYILKDENDSHSNPCDYHISSKSSRHNESQ